MQNHLSSITLLLGLALVPACAGADKTPPVEEPSQPAAQPATEPTATDTRDPNMSGVYLDPELARLCGISSPTALFEFNSAALESADNSGLLALATCVSTGPLKGRQIELIGHTDPRGTVDHNTQLGKSRADSVMQFLANKGGVPADRMVTRTEGEKQADPNDAEGWPYDRRVDIRLVP